MHKKAEQVIFSVFLRIQHKDSIFNVFLHLIDFCKCMFPLNLMPAICSKQVRQGQQKTRKVVECKNTPD